MSNRILPIPRERTAKIDTLKASLLRWLHCLGGDGGGFHVAKGNREQAGIQRLHDQALVGTERSRVGIWLGLCALSKLDDPPSQRLWRDRQHGNAERGKSATALVCLDRDKFSGQEIC